MRNEYHKKTSFIVVTHNSLKDLSLYFETFLKFNISEDVFFNVIDTSQDHGLLKLGEKFSKRLNVEIHFVENKGYAFACNYGYEHAVESSIYVFSNPDIIFTSNIIERIQEEFDENTYGTVIQKNRLMKNCTFNLYPQCRNIVTEVLFFHKFLNWVNWYDPRFITIGGAFMILGRNVIKEYGLFDDNYFLYYEENDYFYRLRRTRNFKIIWDTYIIHNTSSSVDKNLAMNRFKIQADSLYYYSKKFNDFSYFKNLIMLYRISSVFIRRHKQKLNFLREKEINA